MALKAKEREKVEPKSIKKKKKTNHINEVQNTQKENTGKKEKWKENYINCGERPEKGKERSEQRMSSVENKVFGRVKLVELN